MHVKFGSIVTAGVGKLGGHQFQRGRGATQLVTKRSGHKRHKQSSTRRQLQVAELAAIWQSFSPSLKKEWSNLKYLARNQNPFFSEEVFLNGWAAFLGINSWRINFGMEILTDDFVKDMQAYPTPTGQATLMSIFSSTFNINVEMVVSRSLNEPQGISPYFKIAFFNHWQSLPPVSLHRSVRGLIEVTGSGNASFPLTSLNEIGDYHKFDRVSIISWQFEGYAASEGNVRFVGAWDGESRYAFI